MSNRPSSRTVTGKATARGFAMGPVYVYRGGGSLNAPEYALEPGRETDEVLRLRRARVDARRDLEGLVAVLRERTGRDDVRVFEGHLMILEDPLLVSESERLVCEEHLNAEAAVRRATAKFRAQFARMNDPFFRERVRDLDDVERRLVKVLLGCGADIRVNLRQPSVIVADDLAPSEIVQLPRECVLGFATEGGSATSHVALLARAMGIPAVTGLGDITTRAKAGETVLLDGTTGTLTFDPTPEETRAFRELVELQRELTERTATGRPAGMLREGGDVPLEANAQVGVPLDSLREYGARGIGLYRSEYLWLNRETEPTEDEQFVAYRAAAEAAQALGDGAHAVLRVLDIGGDKAVRGITAHEANPFLGNRSLRYLLAHRDVFNAQLKAMLRASAFGPVSVLIPMVSCVEELVETRAQLAAARAELEREGLAVAAEVPLGAMIEVPAAALNAAALARHVDFFSIGTNDLVQYTMAADRGNEAVSRLYQPTNPSVLRLVRMTVAAAKARGIPVSVCGESASDPVVGTLWVALGVQTLSMSPSYIPQMAKLLSRLTRADLDAYAQAVEALDEGLTAAEILEQCTRFLEGRVADFARIVL